MACKTTRGGIIEAADLLFYQQGYTHTSFADIADAVKISRGNFYYHFKSKDEILEAVIQLRMAKISAMLEQWEAEGETPSRRIEKFIRIQITNGAQIKQHGCPIGTLCNELAKLDHKLHGAARALFTLLRDWLRGQFELLGERERADELAMHLLAASQGVATLANAFGDDQFVEREVQKMCDWLKLQKEN